MPALECFPMFYCKVKGEEKTLGCEVFFHFQYLIFLSLPKIQPWNVSPCFTLQVKGEEKTLGCEALEARPSGDFIFHWGYDHKQVWFVSLNFFFQTSAKVKRSFPLIRGILRPQTRLSTNR